MGSQINAIKMPGRVFEYFVERAEYRLMLGEDIDLCDALSRARVKRRGLGYTVFVKIEPLDDARKLVAWITPKDPKYLRDYRALVEQSLDALQDSKEG